MYHRTLTNLLKLGSVEFKQFIDSFDTVLTDCDGVLWLENVILEGSPQVMNRFRELGKKIFYVTNNSTKLKQDFIKKAKHLGFICEEHEMISTAYLAAHYLKEKGVKKAYVMASSGVTQELDNVGIQHIGLGPDVMQASLAESVHGCKLDPDVEAVVVGFDEHISYMKLLKAASYLANPKCHYVATNTDENFPTESNLLVPGTGTMVRAVSTCAGREPVVMGKPNSYIAEAIMKEHYIDPKRTLMIGDRCNTDIQLGANCGFQTLLVLTGVTSLKKAIDYKHSENKNEYGYVPDVYLNKLGDILPLLE